MKYSEISNDYPLYTYSYEKYYPYYLILKIEEKYYPWWKSNIEDCVAHVKIQWRIKTAGCRKVRPLTIKHKFVATETHHVTFSLQISTGKIKIAKLLRHFTTK